MRPLPNIYLKKPFSQCSSWNKNLKQLTEKIEREDNPVAFKDQLLSIIQLYFNGLLSENDEQSKEELPDKLCLAGKKAMGSFYRGEGIDFDSVKEMFLPYASEIIEQNPEGAARCRHLLNYQQEVYQFGLKLPDILNGPFDTLVCVATGGFEPSFLAMDIMEKDSLIPVRYSHRRQMDTKVKILKKASAAYPRMIKDKKVLVIEDWTIDGKSLVKVMKYVAKMEPSELYSAAVTGSTPGISIPGSTKINPMDPYIFKVNNTHKKNSPNSSLIFSELERRMR